MSTTNLDSLELAASERALLERYGFDVSSFLELKADLAAGRFPPDRNRLRAPVSPPSQEDLVSWPANGTPEAAACDELGARALGRGEVAVAILNGGMATRFGGTVKCLVEVADGRNFLQLKLSDVARHGHVPVFLMNSFATEAETTAALEHDDYYGLDRRDLHLIAQRLSLRLTPQGDLYREPSGGVSFFAPGHGDIFAALAGAPGFQRFVAGGGKMVLISNVDNIAATLSPRVIGAHLRAGRRVTVEVAPRAPGDQGGAPARVGGHLEVVEGFRFPKDFDIAAIPVFNTNTLAVDVAAVRADYPLTWFRADKTVDGHPVVQFERLMGEVTAFEDATFLSVPREGPEGRFLPVKTPDDLPAVRELVRALWPARR